MNSKLSKIEKVWKAGRPTSAGCGKSMMKTLGIGWNDLDKLNDKLCLHSRQATASCASDCVFSCVAEDVDMMAQVLSTLEVVSEQTK